MLKTRFFFIFICFILVFCATNGAKAEVFEQDGVFIDYPNTMEQVKSDLPLVVTQLKYKNRDFPTITITYEHKDKNASALPQEIEVKLKETYENLGFNVTSSTFLKSQKISTYTSNLYEIEYTYNGILFISLVNMFDFNDKTYFITIINKIDSSTPLKETHKLQDEFLKYISLQKDDNTFSKETSSATKSDDSTSTPTNIIIACVVALFGAMLIGSKKA